MSKKKSYFNDKYTVTVEITVESTSADDAQDLVAEVIHLGLESIYNEQEDIGEIKYDITDSELSELFKSE